ncbi:chemokine-like receptor 1 [Rana temporaria]|uniref:chemokine-like receptor 1 n=1 Tax=Rana temporaria TaxID=8407 RepID=UPI001AAD8366|nr:chemokine-like receptor 1 [Rana temporaria]
MDFTVPYPTADVTQGEIVTSSVTNNIPIMPTYNDYDERLRYALRIIYMIGHILAFVLGTIGNGLVIYFTVFKMRRTVNIVWYLNLAIADFTFMFVLIFRIITVAINFNWIFGGFMCRMNNAIFFINLYASILLITAISIDRCISVIYPVWCQNHRTPRLASYVALAIWILAIIFSVPYVIYLDTKVIGKRTVCTYNIEDKDVAKAIDIGLAISRFIFSFVIPLVVIISCYAIILLRIRRKRMTTSSKPFKIAVAVIIAFFVCWFPLHLFFFLELSLDYCGNHHLKYVVLIAIPLCKNLAVINSCINPIIYVFVGRDFKEKFWRSFQSIFESAFMEEPIQASSRSKSRSTADSQLL